MAAVMNCESFPGVFVGKGNVFSGKKRMFAPSFDPDWAAKKDCRLITSFKHCVDVMRC